MFPYYVMLTVIITVNLIQEENIAIKGLIWYDKNKDGFRSYTQPCVEV